MPNANKFVRAILLFLVLFVAVSNVEAKHHKSSSYGYLGTGSNSQDTYVRGYTKKNGTHVNGYWRTKPNETQKDNYSTEGNINPHTGKKGHEKAKY